MSERTVYTRLEEPWFRRRIGELQRQILLRTVAKLTLATDKAADAFVALLDHPEVDPKIKLGAAQGVFRSLIGLAELAVHGDQIRELHERLDQLQRQEKPGRKRIGLRPHVRIDKLPEP